MIFNQLVNYVMFLKPFRSLNAQNVTSMETDVTSMFRMIENNFF